MLFELKKMRIPNRRNLLNSSIDNVLNIINTLCPMGVVVLHSTRLRTKSSSVEKMATNTTSLSSVP